jgi:hypothetical protein
MKKLFLLLSCSLCLSAAEFGLVSPELLLLLHPEMQNYHFVLHSFWQKGQQESAKELISSFHKLQAEEMENRKKLQLSFFTARKTLFERKKRFPQQSAGITRELKELEKRRQQDFNDHNSHYQAKEMELLNNFFLLPADRNRKLQEIKTEIRQIIKKTAHSMKLGTLFYEAYEPDIPELILNLNREFLTAHHIFSGNEVFLLSRLNINKEDRRLDTDPNFIAAHSALIKYTKQSEEQEKLLNLEKEKSELNAYLKTRLRKKRMSEARPDCRDINAAVLKNIYDKYRIKTTAAQTIIEALRK